MPLIYQIFLLKTDIGDLGFFPGMKKCTGVFPRLEEILTPEFNL